MASVLECARARDLNGPPFSGYTRFDVEDITDIDTIQLHADVAAVLAARRDRTDDRFLVGRVYRQLRRQQTEVCGLHRHGDARLGPFGNGELEEVNVRGRGDIEIGDDGAFFISDVISLAVANVLLPVFSS